MTHPRILTVLLAFAGLGLAGFLSTAAISTAVSRENPQLAVSVFPYNGYAQVRLADYYFRLAQKAEAENSPQADEYWSRAQALARQSLATLPLNPKAFRILAFATSEKEEKERLLRAGDTLSRRDSLTQISLVEASALRGDWRASLDHYDALLRRKTAYQDIAGRGLAKAMAVPQIAQEVGVMLRRDPPWSSLLYHYLLQEPESYSSFVSLHRDLNDEEIIPSEISGQFAAALVEGGRIDDALEIAALLGPIDLRPTTRLQDDQFVTGAPLPGRWLVADDASIGIQAIREGGTLLTFNSGVSGVIARRLIQLKPGLYDTKIVVESNDDGGAISPNPEIEARIRCAGSEQDSSADMREFEVRAECPYQWLSLVFQSPTLADGELFISSVEVAKND